MSGQVEMFIWTILVILSFTYIGFLVAETALRWKKQRNEAWIEWETTLVLLAKAHPKAFDSGVELADGSDEASVATWGLVKDSHSRYKRASGKRLDLYSKLTSEEKNARYRSV